MAIVQYLHRSQQYGCNLPVLMLVTAVPFTVEDIQLIILRKQVHPLCSGNNITYDFVMLVAAVTQLLIIPVLMLMQELIYIERTNLTSKGCSISCIPPSADSLGM